MRLALAFLLLALALPASAQRNLPTATVSTLDGLMLRIPVTTPTNEVVSVLGYHSEGDWGAPRVAKHEPASVASTNRGCVFAATTTGRWSFEDCESGQVDVRWFGGTNDVATLAYALTWVLSRDAEVELVSRAVYLADGVAPTAAVGTLALYATNVSGVHELGIAHGGGSNDLVATKGWVSGGAGSGATIAAMPLPALLATSTSGFVDGATYLVSGYVTDGDWGSTREATFKTPSALATNLGCVFNATPSGQWVFDDCDGPEINFAWFGPYPDNSVDNTARLRSATTVASAKNACLYVPPGTYKVTNAINVIGNLSMRGSGKSSIFDFTAAAIPSGHCMMVQGVLTSGLPAVYSPIVAGGSNIVLSSSYALSPQDVLLISSTNLWNRQRTYYYQGEFVRVQSVTGGTNIVTFTPFFDSYDTNGLSILKMTPAVANIRDMVMKFPGDGSLSGLEGALIGLDLEYCGRSVVQDVHLSGTASGQLRLHRCYEVTLSGISTMETNTPGVGIGNYGVVIGNSQKVTLDRSVLFAGRHGVTLGGVVTPVSREVLITGCVIGSDIVAGADCHGSSEFISFIGNQLTSGIECAGDNIQIIGNTIGNVQNNGCLIITEMLGANFTVRGNTFRHIAPTATMMSVGPMATTTRTNGTFIFQGNKVSCDSALMSGYPTTTFTGLKVFFYDAQPYLFDALIEGNEFNFTTSSTGRVDAIFINQSSTMSLHNVMIRNNTIKSGRIMCTVNLRGLFIEGNSIFDAPVNAIEASLYSPQLWATPQIAINDNRIHRANEAGIYFDGDTLKTATCTVLRNTVIDCNVLSNSADLDKHGIVVTEAGYADVMYNLIGDTRTPPLMSAIHITGGTTRARHGFNSQFGTNVLTSSITATEIIPELVNLTASGTITASNFVGSGAGLTNLISSIADNENSLYLVGDSALGSYGVGGTFNKYAPAWPGTNVFTLGFKLRFPETGDAGVRAIAVLSSGNIGPSTFVIVVGSVYGAASLWIRSFQGSTADYISAYDAAFLNRIGTEPHVLLVSLDRTNRIPNVWLDGLLLTNLTMVSNGLGGSWAAGNHNSGGFRLTGYNTGTNNIFNGSYLKAAAWNYAFTQADADRVSTKWITPADQWGTTNQPGAILDWDLGLGGGTSVSDHSVYGNHGAIIGTNGTWYANQFPTRPWSGTTTVRDYKTNWLAGDLWYNTTGNELQVRGTNDWLTLVGTTNTPTANGAYVLFVTNGVASWIAHP